MLSPEVVKLIIGELEEEIIDLGKAENIVASALNGPNQDAFMEGRNEGIEVAISIMMAHLKTK